MARVFLSHASADVAATDRVHGWLVDSGHEVFLDHDPHHGIAVGDDWHKRLHERLRWAEAVVCVLTEAYTRSTWCTAEATIALSRGAWVVPVVLEAGVRHPLFASLQHLDATVGGDAARDRLATVLLRITDSGCSLPDGVSPFPGLRPFDVDRRLVFFGRETDIQRLGAELRSPAERAEGALFVIVGPSGCGKSSLVRAGLLPRVAEEPDQFTLGACVPGRDPVGAIARELADAATRRLRLPGWSIEQVRRRAVRDGLGEVVDELLLAVPGRRRTRLVVVVDQFEELLTQAPPDARADFARLVGPALHGSLQVIATLRPEFLHPLMSSPELVGLRTTMHPLGPMSRAGIAAAIENPARIAGIELDDGLVDELVTDTGSGDALPLLAYTLAELAEGVTRGGRLTLGRYRQLGGVQGTLRAQADQALETAAARIGQGRAGVLAALLRLVAIDEQGRPTRVRVPRAQLPPGDAAALDEFVRRRLLVTSTVGAGPDRTAVVGVAHEAFLTAWSPLADAIRRDPMALRTQRQLDGAAARWTAAGRPARDLWSGSQLRSAVVDIGADLGRSGLGPRRATLVTKRVELAPETAAFVRASMMRPRRQRQGLIAVLTVLLLTMTAIGVIANQQRGRATEQQRLAVARQLLTQADATRVADARTALLLGLAAQRLNPGPEASAGLVDTLTHTRYSRTLAGPAMVLAVAWSPDGRTLVTGDVDGHATLWDVTDPRHPGRLGSPLAAQHGFLYALAFSPDGRTLATAGADRRVVLWDVTDRSAPRQLGGPLLGHPADVHALSFSRDGGVLASVDFSGRLILHDVTDPSAPVTLADVPTGHTDDVVAVAYAPTRPLIATAGFDRAVRLWDVSDTAHPVPVGAPLSARDSALWDVAFAPDGRTLATVDTEGYLVRWDVESPAAPRLVGKPLRAHVGPAYAVVFSHDGSRIATVGADREAAVWSLADPARPSRVERLTGHSDQVYAVAFAADDRMLATGGTDRTTVLWDLAGTGGPSALGPPLTTGPGAVLAASISGDGRWLAVGGADRRIQLWDVTDPARPRSRGDPVTAPAAVRALEFSPTAPVLAAATADGGLVVWDVAGSGPPRQLSGTTVVDAHAGEVSATAYSLAFTADGLRLAVAGGDRSVSLWDVADAGRPERIGSPASDHTGEVYSVALSPTGSVAASAGQDGAVLFWNVSGPTGPRWVRPSLAAGGAPVYTVVFSADGRALAAAGAAGTVLRWQVPAGGLPQPVGMPLLGDGGPIYSVRFSPDGSTLVDGDAAGDVTLWDVSDPATPRRLGRTQPAGVGSVNAVAVSPGGTWLASGGATGRVTLWDLSALRDLRADPVELACAITGRGLDEDEWRNRIPGLDYQQSCPER